jgi:DNA-binding transcriptional ArsR family regulator
MPAHTDRVLDIDSQQRLKALGDDTRARILGILGDRPSSAKEISGLLEMTHGKVGHHMNVLHEAGLIEVVEERRVRAMTEKLYGPTFERLTFSVPGADRLQFTLGQIAREARPSSEQPFEPPAMFITVRMTEERARAFHARCRELMEEFADSGDPDSTNVFGLATSVFLTGTPGR